MRRGSRPISAGPSSRSTVVTSDAQSPAEPRPPLASPKPSAPSLVRTVTRTASKVRRRPKSEVCWAASGIGARSQRASTAAISIGGLWSRAAATRREVRDARPCRPRARGYPGHARQVDLGPGVPDRRAERRPPRRRSPIRREDVGWPHAPVDPQLDARGAPRGHAEAHQASRIREHRDQRRARSVQAERVPAAAQGVRDPLLGGGHPHAR